MEATTTTAFDPTIVDYEQLAQAWSAGFVVAATGLVIIWAARSVLEAIGVAASER